MWLSRRLAAMLALGVGLTTTAWGLDTSQYHDFAAVEAKLREWSRTQAARMTFTSIGKSAGGKDLWVAQIAGQGAVKPDERPAIFVGANIAGYHNAGTEAALDLVSTLLAATDKETTDLLASHTFYVAPVLNPDAHDTLFSALHLKRMGAAGSLDRDRDGLVAEDGADDLDGDGRITWLRIPDAAGGWLPHPGEPRLMVHADAAKGWVGRFRLETEGRDDDGDGAFNEDGPGGVAPSRNFPHAFPYADAEAGPWPSFAPETKAVMDFLLAHRNVALAVVYGPANNFLSPPKGLGAGGAVEGQRFKIPERIAGYLGFDANQEYTIDEIWDVAKNLPIVRQRNLTKDQLAQFLGAGPATKVHDDDQARLDKLAKAYKERLKAAGLDADRPGESYQEGGLTPWLYYQYGVMTFELDVWGVPKPKKAEDKDAPITLESLAKMTSDELLAQPVEKIAAFLVAIKAPPMVTADSLLTRVRSGQATPAQLAEMAKSMGAKDPGAEDKDDEATARSREILAWVDANAKDAVTPWKEVTLADGTKAEVGGLDPLAALAPPYATLAPALTAHTKTVLDAAGKLARIEIASLTATPLGGDVFRIRAVAANRGELPTHTAMAMKARAFLPVRLTLGTDDGVELVSGHPTVKSESLDGSTGTLEAEWLVHAPRVRSLTVVLESANAGRDRKSIELPAGAKR